MGNWPPSTAGMNAAIFSAVTRSNFSGRFAVASASKLVPQIALTQLEISNNRNAPMPFMTTSVGALPRVNAVAQIKFRDAHSSLGDQRCRSIRVELRHIPASSLQLHPTPISGCVEGTVIHGRAL